MITDAMLAEIEALYAKALHDVPVCCGRGAVGAEYMGSQEIICCGQPDYEPGFDPCQELINFLGDELPELLRLARIGAAVEAAPVAWAGDQVSGGICADTSFKSADDCAIQLSGWGDAEEQARVKARRVRIVPVPENDNG